VEVVAFTLLRAWQQMHEAHHRHWSTTHVWWRDLPDRNTAQAPRPLLCTRSEAFSW